MFKITACVFPLKFTFPPFLLLKYLRHSALKWLCIFVAQNLSQYAYLSHTFLFKSFHRCFRSCRCYYFCNMPLSPIRNSPTHLIAASCHLQPSCWPQPFYFRKKKTTECYFFTIRQQWPEASHMTSTSSRLRDKIQITSDFLNNAPWFPNYVPYQPCQGIPFCDRSSAHYKNLPSEPFKKIHISMCSRDTSSICLTFRPLPNPQIITLMTV